MAMGSGYPYARVVGAFEKLRGNESYSLAMKEDEFEDHDDNDTSERSSPTKRAGLLQVLWKTIVCLLATWGIVSIVLSIATSTSDNHFRQDKHTDECYCGDSTAEAVALGCKFDSLGPAWLPNRCRDDELTAEFETMRPGINGSWTYWADKGRTQELSLPEVAELANDPLNVVHMSSDWHIAHCYFYWRKQYRATQKKTSVEPRFDNEGHIKHCGKIILAGAEGHSGTQAGVGLIT